MVVGESSTEEQIEIKTKVTLPAPRSSEIQYNSEGKLTKSQIVRGRDITQP